MVTYNQTVEIANEILQNNIINSDLFLYGLYKYTNGTYLSRMEYRINHPPFKKAIKKLSERTKISDFSRLYQLYNDDKIEFMGIVKEQYEKDNSLLSKNKYYLLQHIIKTFNIELLEFIFNKHDEAIIFYFLKNLRDLIYNFSSSEKTELYNFFEKFFTNSDINCSLIYFYSFMNETNHSNEYTTYMNILYSKLEDTLSINENIEIFNKIINGKHLELMKKVITKIKPHYNVDIKYIISNIYYDQNKVELIIKYFDIKVDDELIMYLLDLGCYYNKEYKINNKILEICSKNNFYPYKINFIPSEEVMLIEASKNNNFDIYKQFHTLGAKLSLEQLKNACGVKFNSQYIKYIIDNGIKADEECIEIFKNTYNNVIINNFIDNYLEKDFIDNNELLIKLNNKYLFSIEKNELINENDIDKKYSINKKILKLFNIEKEERKTVEELKELFLKYLVNNKLVISHYFVIDEALSKIFKNIKKCTLMEINQISNLISYFIIE